jgi:hypothetical protein
MKTRIFLILLFVSSFVFAQTWNQVGTTQFSTNFSLNGELAFNNTGVPYVLYESPTNNGVYVMKFNGSSWEDVGSGAISTENYNNLTIKINPSTNQPWVAMKAQASGTASNIDVYSYNGSSWVSEGSNVGGSFYTYGIQLQFNASGTPRLAGTISSGGSDRRPQFFTKSGSNWTHTVGYDGLNERVDFYDYNSYVIADSDGRVRKYNVDGSGGVTFLNNSSKDYIEISGGVDYYATNNITDGTIVTGIDGITMTQPTGVSGNTNSILKFRKSSTDDQHYLMYSNSAENLVFQKYNFTNSWTTLPSTGIPTNTTDFFAKMEMNSVDGNMYVLYKDGGKMSVKKFTVEPLLNLPRLYVDVNATGTSNGDSWANAYTSLNNALANIYTNTTEIWVAAGIYKPGVNRSDSFILNANNLEVYGGFDGTETVKTERDISANLTILSGDVNNDDSPLAYSISTGLSNANRQDNNYHVLEIAGNDIIVDGFQIQRGYANGTINYGGGIYVSETSNSLNLKNCTFYDNYGQVGGAVRAYFNINAAVNIENCIFNNNISRYGSGLYILANNNRTVTVNITNSLFNNNTTFSINSSNKGYTGSAAWIRANGTSSNVTTVITNCTITNNEDLGTEASSDKGALSLSRRVDGNSTHSATINNSIFYNNDGASNVTTVAVNKGHTSLPNQTIVNNSIDEDSFSNLTYLSNTSNANPMFTGSADFALQTGSPAIDTGDNTKIPTGITTDLLGNHRIFNATVDMGAYEFGSSPLGVNKFNFLENDVKVFPNPTSSFLNIKMDSDLKRATVYSVLGAKILETTSKIITTSNLKSGLYLIKIEAENGSISTKRFMKE